MLNVQGRSESIKRVNWVESASALKKRLDELEKEVQKDTELIRIQEKLERKLGILSESDLNKRCTI